MAERQLSFTANEVAHLVNRANMSFREGAFSEAIEVLEQALRLDVEHDSIASALKCAAFWKERESRLSEITDPYERAEYLEKEWETFQPFVSRLENTSDRTVFDIKQYVMNECLSGYLSLLSLHPEEEDSDLLMRIGRGYKGLGDYEQAIDHLERASRAQRQSAIILAELADCYALINEDRYARVLFREAFFINADLIQIDRLESPVIRRLIDTIEQADRPTEEFSAWIPVYATLHGFFSVKRELKPLELGRLKQAIFAMEHEISVGDPASTLKPRLLNHYFWLIDQYVSAGEEKTRITDVLTKLKNLDRQVYDEYVR